MKIYELSPPAGNRLIEAFIKAEEISDGRVDYSPYGLGMNSRLPNGAYLNFTVDPYIYYKSTIPNPEDIEIFTVRFVAYTEKRTPEGLMAAFLTNEEVETLLEPTDSRTRQICDGVKEMNGLELILSRKEYMEAEGVICERERLELEELCRQSEDCEQEENSFDAPSL